MNNFDFDKVQYHRYRDFASEFYISELIGFDSETYVDGKPFMFCDSDGGTVEPRYLLAYLFGREEKRIDFATYNLKFDSGSVISLLPFELKTALAVEKEVTCDGVKWTYIPHKMLRLKWKSYTRNFWDIFPFYRMELDRAAFKYLGERKLEMETKSFTRDYVIREWDRIERYCRRDAELTARLGNLLLGRMKRFGIKPRTIYSAASVSFTHFRRTCPYMHVWRFWKLYRPLLEAACASYSGGKFEVTSRGRFMGYEWDLSGAYAYEISRLLNLDYARAVRQRRYHDGADYGFMRVVIDNRAGRHIPVAYKRGTLNVYPAGKWEAWITKQEFDYMAERGIGLKILDAWWLVFGEHYYPYRDEVMKCYRIKERFKKSDPLMSKLGKDLPNTLYGKFVQVTEKPDGSQVAGPGWNPIFAAVITANIRLRVTRLQEELDRACLAVHTDSIITTRKMPESFGGNGLGNWELKQQGDGVIIACGLYQIGAKSANRGYIMPEEHAWIRQLEAAGKSKMIDMSELRVHSWTSQISRGRDDMINVFERLTKRMNLNCEAKRIWPRQTNARRLLERLEHSAPIPVLDY